MQTLSDILTYGDQAASEGAPPVTNWRQVRASLLLLHRAVALDRIPAEEFTSRFPESFDDLDAVVQQRFPGRRIYDVVRRENVRLLSALGHGDPWEAQRVLLRELGRDDIETGLSPLRTAGRRAGVAPADMSAAWVWSLDAERTAAAFHPLMRDAREMSALLRQAPFRPRRQAVEARRAYRRAWNTRQQLRRAVVLFDALFDLPEFVERGLLPPARIGPPPEYDRRGRRRVTLPPTLARICAAELTTRPTNLQELWQAIKAAGGLGLPADPAAEDLLALWGRIAALPASLLAVSESSWVIYRQRARAALRRHASSLPPDPRQLPPHLDAMASSAPERWALRALWHRILDSDDAAIGTLGAHELLELPTWRALWRRPAEKLRASSLRQYEIAARKVLLRHAPDQMDPRRRVREAWAALPKLQKERLAPIRKPAEQAMLQPCDITPDWLEAARLADTERAVMCAALESLKHEDKLPATSTMPPIAGSAMCASGLRAPRWWAVRVSPRCRVPPSPRR